MKRFTILLFVALIVVSCATGGNINTAITKSAVSTAVYSICKNNPEAIKPMQAVCFAPDSQLSTELSNLYKTHVSVVEDPFLKMQIEIILEAFAEEYGVDVKKLDFASIERDKLRPFVDMMCLGASAAASSY